MLCSGGFLSGPHKAVFFVLSLNITAAITEAQHVRDFNVLLFITDAVKLLLQIKTLEIRGVISE